MKNTGIGRIHSVQSLGTLDGPGVRFVIFTQGCNLRCGCCHNPDTWSTNDGTQISAEELVSRALRYVEYFGKDGGVTVSGGEPLMQTEFVTEIFSLCKKHGINTCLDTSGSIITERTDALLSLTDRVLLDIKYTSNEKYKEYVGCSLDTPLAFLELLEKKEVPTTVRQVIIPTLNDSENDILKLKALTKRFSCVDKIELLPFKKICSVKYESMGIPFPFSHVPTPTNEKMRQLEGLIAKID